VVASGVTGSNLSCTSSCLSTCPDVSDILLCCVGSNSEIAWRRLATQVVVLATWGNSPTWYVDQERTGPLQ